MTDESSHTPRPAHSSTAHSQRTSLLLPRAHTLLSRGPLLTLHAFVRRNSTVNYEDPNYNVQLPVFSIHGNHDDPAGDGGLAALDLLSTANLVRPESWPTNSSHHCTIPNWIRFIAMWGCRTCLSWSGFDQALSPALPPFLTHVCPPEPTRSRVWRQVNYFGRVGDIEKIALKPVLIRKGGTKLALYGLGHVRDERLARSFEHKGVSVARAVPNPEEWFSLMVIHQNRHPRGVGTVMKGYIKDGMLPSCMDMVIWGHEHECQARHASSPPPVCRSFCDPCTAFIV